MKRANNWRRRTAAYVSIWTVKISDPNGRPHLWSISHGALQPPGCASLPAPVWCNSHCHWLLVWALHPKLTAYTVRPFWLPPPRICAQSRKLRDKEAAVCDTSDGLTEHRRVNAPKILYHLAVSTSIHPRQVQRVCSRKQLVNQSIKWICNGWSMHCWSHLSCQRWHHSRWQMW